MSRGARASVKRKKGNSRWTAEEARAVLVGWEHSGLSIAEFCRQRGISANRFYWWRTRLAKWAGSNQAEQPSDQELKEQPAILRLVEAEMKPATVKKPLLTVQLRSGDQLEIFDANRIEPLWLVRLSRGLLEQAGQ